LFDEKLTRIRGSPGNSCTVWIDEVGIGAIESLEKQEGVS